MTWLIKQLAKAWFAWYNKIRVTGIEHAIDAQTGEKPVLIIANHLSLLDGLLIELFVPGKTTFMVDKNHLQKSWVKFFLRFTRYEAVDMASPLSIKHLIDHLKKGEQCAIFPEGRITTTGSLMKIYEGAALVAEKAGATILPVQITGAQYSKWSMLDGTNGAYVQRKSRAPIGIHILAAREIHSPADISRHDKHAHLKSSLERMMRDMAFEASFTPKSLHRALVESAEEFDAKAVCVEDIRGGAISRKKLLLATRVLGGKLDKMLKGEYRVGLMLPNVAGMPATFFSLQAYGYVPAMINFTAGVGPVLSACETAELKTIITSKAFVEALSLEKLCEALEAKHRVIYLEDVRAKLNLFDKLGGLFGNSARAKGMTTDPESEAVVLFTSGSEGAPKGVVLSHANILANVEQCTALFAPLPNEQVFNALPTFHSFGMTAGMIWPILKGARVFMYPSPLHYAEIPELIYQTNTRIFFATDTFFNGYGRKANPYDFQSLRVMAAGAEKLRTETRRLYADKFGKPLFEGYGVTETSPVLAVNIPQAFKHGTVGQFVPGIEWRLEPVEGIAEGGRLWVKGPNVMKGYLLADQPGVLVSPNEGWHDTGDIVSVDVEGYVRILGRAKRFAKIGGEMVSLTAVESYISELNPDGHHVVVSVPDERKGEQLILVTNDQNLSKASLLEAARTAQVSDLMIPKTVILIEEVPVLGTGKTNYPEVQKIAERHFGIQHP